MMIEFAEVVAVLQNVGQRPVGQRDPADDFAVRQTALARYNGFPAQLPLQSRDRAQFLMAFEDLSDELRFFFLDNELAVLDTVAEWRNAAHPQTLLFRRGDLVPDPLAGDLPLELGEGEQDVQGQAPPAGRGVEGLGD